VSKFKQNKRKRLGFKRVITLEVAANASKRAMIQNNGIISNGNWTSSIDANVFASFVAKAQRLKQSRSPTAEKTTSATLVGNRKRAARTGK